MRTRIVWRRLRGPLLAVVIAPTAGCESDASSSPAASASGSVAPPSTTPRRLGELAIQPDYAMSVEAVRDCPSPPGLGPRSGYRHLGAEVLLEGRSQRQVPANPFYAQLVDADDERYESLLTGCTPVLDPALLTAEGSTRGWITFEVPQSARRLELVYAPSILGAERQASRFALEP